MPIYVRPGGNDALGGTNDTSDALQTLNAAVLKYDRTNPDKRDIVLCADTVGGTANFSGTAGFRFLNNNESLWQFGTSAAQRMSIQGRVGDTINFLASSSYWFAIKDTAGFFSFFNFHIDATEMSGGNDPPIKVFEQGGQTQEGFILDELSITGAMKDGVQFTARNLNCIARNLTVWDVGRVTADGANHLYLKGRGWLVEGNYLYNLKTPATNEGGLRCYNNEEDIVNGKPEAALNIIRKNYCKRLTLGVVWAGSQNGVFNNIVYLPYLVGLEFIGQASGTNDDNDCFNNTVYGQGTTGVRGFWMANGNQSNFRLTNNICYGQTTPIDKNGETLEEELTNLTTDPLIVSAGSEVFRLQSGSNARNTGTTKAEVTDDYYGVLRPQGVGYDIGAAEFLEAAAPGLSRDRLVNVGLIYAPKRYWFVGAGR